MALGGSGLFLFCFAAVESLRVGRGAGGASVEVKCFTIAAVTGKNKTLERGRDLKEIIPTN